MLSGENSHHPFIPRSTSASKIVAATRCGQLHGERWITSERPGAEVQRVGMFAQTNPALKCPKATYTQEVAPRSFRIREAGGDDGQHKRRGLGSSNPKSEDPDC